MLADFKYVSAFQCFDLGFYATDFSRVDDSRNIHSSKVNTVCMGLCLGYIYANPDPFCVNLESYGSEPCLLLEICLIILSSDLGVPAVEDLLHSNDDLRLYQIIFR